MKNKFLYLRTICLLFAIGKAAHVTLSYSFEDFQLQSLLFIFITLSILFSGAYFALEIAGRTIIVPFSQQIYFRLKQKRIGKSIILPVENHIPKLNPNSATFEEIFKYIRETFHNILSSKEMEILTLNIKSLISSNYSYEKVLDRRIPNLRTTDLYHLGWNIGKRLKKTNPQIALLLKQSFPWQFSNVEITTIASKLTSTEGAFFIPITPLHQPLEPFPLAQKLGIC